MTLAVVLGNADLRPGRPWTCKLVLGEAGDWVAPKSVLPPLHSVLECWSGNLCSWQRWRRPASSVVNITDQRQVKVNAIAILRREKCTMMATINATTTKQPAARFRPASNRCSASCSSNISRCNMPSMMQQSMGCLQGQSIVTPSWKNPKISPETVLANHDPGTWRELS